MTHYWLIPAGFVVIGLILWFFTKRYNPPKTFGEYGRITSNVTKKMAPVFFPIYIGVSALAFIILLISGISNYNKTLEILSGKKFELLAGKVENYKRWSSRRAQVEETFSIDKSDFKFDEKDATYYGYRPNSKKQILDNGMYLRISYYQERSKKIILKIEKGRQIGKVNNVN